MGFKAVWTDDLIRQGLERFYAEHGRYPNAREYDKTSYLPTARQIQRKFGGLPAFRTHFALEGALNFTKGEVRSATAAATFARAYKYEEEFYNFLVSKLPEELVHEQKRIRPGNVDCDFFIYSSTNKSRSIVIDLFYAENLYNLAGIVNIKVKRYRDVSFKTFFICMTNKAIDQSGIDTLMRNKKHALPPHIKVCTEEWFKANLQNLLN